MSPRLATSRHVLCTAAAHRERCSRNYQGHNMIDEDAPSQKGSGHYHAFVSYSHEDHRYRQRLDVSLTQLRRNGLVSFWYDRRILPGQDWDVEIDKHLENADIVLVLASPDFLASEYAYGREMLRALERHESGEAIVVPIIVRPCDWHHSPLAALQALPSTGRPVSTWPNRDQAWLDVVEGLRRLISSQG